MKSVLMSASVAAFLVSSTGLASASGALTCRAQGDDSLIVNFDVDGSTGDIASATVLGSAFGAAFVLSDANVCTPIPTGTQTDSLKLTHTCSDGATPGYSLYLYNDTATQESTVLVVNETNPHGKLFLPCVSR